MSLPPQSPQADVHQHLKDAREAFREGKNPLNNARKAAEAICKHFIVDNSLIPDVGRLANKDLSGLIDIARNRIPKRALAALTVILGYGNHGSHNPWPEPHPSAKDFQLGMDGLESLATWYSETYGENCTDTPVNGDSNSTDQLSAQYGGPVTIPQAAQDRPDTLNPAPRNGAAMLTLWLHGRPWVFGGVAVLMLLGALGVWMLTRKASPSASPEAHAPFIQVANARPIPIRNPKNPDAKRIAVLYFDNNSRNQTLDPLKTGLTDMLISDLDGTRAVRVIERERLNAVLKELNLQASVAVDPATSQRLGRILGVEYLLMGSYFELVGQLRLDARLIRVETGEIVQSEGVTGGSQDLFALERQLALKIIQDLGARLGDDEREIFRKGVTTDLPTMLAYSRALDLYDRGDRREAITALETILGKGSSFPQAEQSLARMRRSL